MLTGVVTVTLTVPADPGGTTACIAAEDTTLKEVAATLPNDTLVAPERLLPVMVTVVPPDVEPVVGDTEPTDGAGGGGDGRVVSDQLGVVASALLEERATP